MREGPTQTETGRMREGQTQTETGRKKEEERDRETDGEWTKKVQGRVRERQSLGKRRKRHGQTGQDEVRQGG